MTTDEHRKFARERASMIYRHHLERDRAGCDANHIASNVDYEESLYRGVLAECAFAEMFSLPINRAFYQHGGDNGRDFTLQLSTPQQGPRHFPVDVKCTSVRVSFDAMVRAGGPFLRVPIIECAPFTIYVFGLYHEDADMAEVLRWEWGKTLIDANQRKVFNNSFGQENFVKLFADLRELQELKDRVNPAGFVGYDKDGHFVHYCKCGRWGSISVGVSIHKGQLGMWYCQKCHPNPMFNSR